MQITIVINEQESGTNSVPHITELTETILWLYLTFPIVIRIIANIKRVVSILTCIHSIRSKRKTIRKKHRQRPQLTIAVAQGFGTYAT